MLQEECGELIRAISRYWRRKENSFLELAEEIADVEIMIGQIKQALFHGLDKDHVKNFKIKKMKRLAKMLYVDSHDQT
jgi:NTP pyrophosphatase (non-canonical NTP hydrolase)